MSPRIRSFAFSAVLPPLAGLLMVGLFVSLGFWQLDRAAEKRQMRDSFAAHGEPRTVEPGASYEMYEPLTATGRYLTERQFLLQNIVQDGQLGHYVITPFEYSGADPLLLVNRGWLPGASGDDPRAIGIGDGERTISGRAGRLPRVGIRPGPAFEAGDDWPRRAVWPESQELAAALGRDVLPFVLLLDPEPDSRLVRRWQPQEIGPMRHVGYAVQWFALALAVVVTAVILYRRKRGAPI